MSERIMAVNMNIDDYIEMAKKDISSAANYEMKSDNCELAREIFKRLFVFYDKNSFSGDLIFTWRSPSLVRDGVYVGKRDEKIDNIRTIGNLFPNFCTDKKYSLNTNRNGYMGDFPHDYFDIFLDHVAKYAYDEERSKIKEYYPLKRAIRYDGNMEYFKRFKDFETYLKENYFEDIWNNMQSQPYSEMSFIDYKEISKGLMDSRGVKMLNKLIGDDV